MGVTLDSLTCLSPNVHNNLTCEKWADIISQGYCRFRLFSKYAEIGYFGRLKLFPFQGLTRVHFSLFSENNGFLNIYILK